MTPVESSRFGLRHLFVVVFLVAVCLGWAADRYHLGRKSAAILRQCDELEQSLREARKSLCRRIAVGDSFADYPEARAIASWVSENPEPSFHFYDDLCVNDEGEPYPNCVFYIFVCTEPDEFGITEYFVVTSNDVIVEIGVAPSML